MLLSDLLDIDALDLMLGEGFVRVRTHPMDETWRIFNYTEKAQYEREWNDVTRTCRGLVVGYNDVILARPWPKFFNYGEHETLPMDEPVEVTDKMDGSLGILYPNPAGEWAIATRGSFESDQARVGTAMLHEAFAVNQWWRPSEALTLLFEIIYPENRIVLDYAHERTLVLLGAIDTDTGQVYGPADDKIGPTPFRRTHVFTESDTLTHALAIEPRKNAEGVVVRYVDSGLMVKIKQDDYVALHRIVTGLSVKTVWEALAEGRLPEVVAALPDEFHGWVRDHESRLRDAHETLMETARNRHAEIVRALPGDCTRGQYAALATQSDQPVRAMLFRLLDGRDPSDIAWKWMKPVGQTDMARPTSEDTA